jgi:hypothetical protein
LDGVANPDETTSVAQRRLLTRIAAARSLLDFIIRAWLDFIMGAWSLRAVRKVSVRALDGVCVW